MRVYMLYKDYPNGPTDKACISLDRHISSQHLDSHQFINSNNQSLVIILYCYLVNKML